MESFGGMDDGEWSSFNAICSSTEEAEFMAQLLGNSSLPNDQPNNSNVEFSSACWPGSESDVNMAVVEASSINSSDDTNADMYYHSLSQGNSYTGSGSNILFPLSTNHHICHPSGTAPSPILTRNGSLFSTKYDMMESSNTIKNSSDHQMYTDHYQMKKGDDLSEISKKRTRISLEKSNKLVKAKKTEQKLTSTDINVAENGHRVLQRQNSSRCLSDDDSNASGEFNEGMLPIPPSCSKSKGASTALNLNGKTRASRGSATDPQSLYAKKRREKINERLRILQNLVPNGTKVDISTMLEEAVQYIKFLQLQIKLLSSDDLWMYAPIAYNGMNLELDLNIDATLKS